MGHAWRRRRDLLSYCSNQFLNWLLQYATGILHLLFKSLFFFPPNKKPHPWAMLGGEGGICYRTVATSF